ncbi:deoxyribodipyrimidine photo-lyase, partial [Acinetobacter baumannii]
AKALNEAIISKYKEQRDYPAIKGTTQLSVHLRFGTVSIRQLAKKALTLNESFLNELIWRDFYQMIIHHFPHVQNNQS